MNDAALRNNTAQHRYELVDNGEVVGVAEYALDGDTITFCHTEINKGHEGKGYGSRIAKMALDDAVMANRKILARCEFIAGYLSRHPEYSASLKGG